MPRWTAENLIDYAKRQMAASPNTRREIRERVSHEQIQEGIATSATTQKEAQDVRIQAGLCDGSGSHAERPGTLPLSVLPSVASKRAVRAVGGKGKQVNGYNTAVVLAWLAECGLPAPVPEYRFDKKRKWRFDFAFCPGSLISKVAVEVQGGLFTGGAHVRGAALLREHEKLNAAAIAGWRVLFVTPDQLCTQDTAEMIRQALRFHLE